mgnify:CR=1 FL=1
MNGGPAAPATLPPPGLPGLDPAWSRLVEVPALDDTGDWRNLGIERVLAVSPFVRDFVSWSMGLPVDRLIERLTNDIPEMRTSSATSR